MNENAQMTTAKSVRFERLLLGPIERVFKHLTETKLLPGWFGKGAIEHHSGGKVRLMDGIFEALSRNGTRPAVWLYVECV
jgi:uncharacterized protein YndB with AHSA1/START domain